MRGTQNSHAAIPGLAEEPRWMRLATLGPTDAGDAVVRDNRRSVDDQISYGFIWDYCIMLVSSSS